MVYHNIWCSAWSCEGHDATAAHYLLTAKPAVAIDVWRLYGLAQQGNTRPHEDAHAHEGQDEVEATLLGQEQVGAVHRRRDAYVEVEVAAAGVRERERARERERESARERVRERERERR